MKTNTKKNSKSELKSRPEQSSTESTEARPQEKKLLYVNYKERDFNRNLPTERVLAVLERWMPLQRKMASVVGSWIWIQFQEVPPAEIRRDLSQLGFHWNNKRKLWQHPCGNLIPGAAPEAAAAPAQ
jgi:hypothetical protein